ncbi:MAG: hypothetical protein JWL59_4324 [Chthoniobacteraceae bacterium]|nr:hypothetical protein [Chthoniobacteraceae bacterium]
MNNNSNIKGALLGIALLFLLGFGAYLFIAGIINKLNSVQSDLIKTLVTAMAAVIIAVITLVIGKLLEQQAKIRQELRDKKIPIYERQLSTIFRILFAEKLGQPTPLQEEILSAFSDFTRELIIWGSSDVIIAWQHFRTQAVDPADPMNSLLAMEVVLRAIRKDLGNNISKLESGALIRLFINN